MRAPYLVVIAFLAAPAGAAEQQYTQEQQDACGSILCLAGGSGTPECSPYLKKYFDMDSDDRGGYLKKCPNSGVSDAALATLVQHGQNCQKERIVAYLNRRICVGDNEGGGLKCREPRADDWQRVCGSYFAELTDDEPPKLVQRCEQRRDNSGSFERTCSFRWEPSEYQVGIGCQKHELECEEAVVGG